MKKLIKWCAAAGAVSLLSGCIIMAAAAGLGGSIPGSRLFHPLRGIFWMEERAEDFFDHLGDEMEDFFDRDDDWGGRWEHHWEHRWD